MASVARLPHNAIVQPSTPLTDQQIREHPAFSRLTRLRRIDQVTSGLVIIALITVVILAFRRVIDNPLIPWFPVAAVGTAVQLYDLRAETTALNEISADPATRRRVQLLVKPRAEKRFLRFLP